VTEKFWDLLIRGATVFDGSGEAPRVEDVAVRDGRIAARGVGLPESGAAEVIDADGKWLMPELQPGARLRQPAPGRCGPGGGLLRPGGKRA